jgi:predicted Zn-dependent protease
LPREFKIYHSENVPDDIIDHVERLLNDIFDMSFRIVGVRIPRQNCWNDSKHSFDAKALVSNVGRDSITYFTWIIDKPLIVSQENVYGHAEPLKGSIVTTSKLATKTLIAKEVAFHVGKVLGLKKCSENCLMRESENFERLIHKPSILCKTCKIRYQRLKIRYV